MARKGHSYETKLEAVKGILEGRIGIKILARQLGTTTSRIYEWLSKYKTDGASGLQNSPTNRHYPSAIKEAAVKEYLAGKSSLQGITEKYGIKSPTQLRIWIKKYNGHEELKTTGGGGTIVTKGRKTTIDERVEIVKACIEQNHNYNLIAQTYQVSYQQVREWTKKYEQSGLEGLYDRRGKRKPETAMSDVEKLQAQIKLKEAENLRLRMENDLLKKLAELERGEG
jgi:transposase-like protein